MPIDFVQVGLAFIEGVALIISPCILPILPIILSGSLTGSRSRPYGIIAGFILTFTVVTLFSRALIQYAHISEDVLRTASFVILFLLGVVMISTYLTDKFNFLTQRLLRFGSSFKTANQIEGGFFSGLLFGGLIGVIWTPCAGPILAAVIVQVVVQQTTYATLLTVVAFAIGVGLPMLLIAKLGRQLLSYTRFINEHTVMLRQLLGVIIIGTVIYLAFFATAATTAPTLANHSAKISGTKLMNGLEHPYAAPEIAGIDTWINSKPLQLSDLRDKVVLIDFWTYSCINCIRTLPYLKDWYAKYHDKGLVIIGVHSPEFEFEHNADNVKNAVISDHILYPVALDNKFVTWQNFKNQYWPAHYLINKEGQVVYEHYGEGEYDTTENNIQFLLGLTAPIKAHREENYSSVQTPETYLGFARGERFASPEAIVKNALTAYHFPATLAKDYWALQGKWTVNAEMAIAGSPGAAIRLHFLAGKVFMVMGTQGGEVKVKVQLTNAPLADTKGTDLLNNQITVSKNKIYSLLNFTTETDGILEVTAEKPGLTVYTFTFGN